MRNRAVASEATTAKTVGPRLRFTQLFVEALPMSMEAIRRTRGVPAKRGMRVWDRYKKDFGTIKGARGGYLRIQLDSNHFAVNYHPTWMLDYLDKDGKVIYSSKD